MNAVCPQKSLLLLSISVSILIIISFSLIRHAQHTFHSYTDWSWAIYSVRDLLGRYYFSFYFISFRFIYFSVCLSVVIQFIFQFAILKLWCGHRDMHDRPLNLDRWMYAFHSRTHLYRCMVYFERIFSRAINSLRLPIGDKLYLQIFCHRRNIMRTCNLRQQILNFPLTLAVDFLFSLFLFMQYLQTLFNQNHRKG